MVPDTSGAGDAVQIYSTYHQGTASTVYAIKDANGDMVPVSDHSSLGAFTTLTVEETANLSDLPSWPSTNSVKLYQTFLTQVTDADNGDSQLGIHS